MLSPLHSPSWQYRKRAKSLELSVPVLKIGRQSTTKFYSSGFNGKPGCIPVSISGFGKYISEQVVVQDTVAHVHTLTPRSSIRPTLGNMTVGTKASLVVVSAFIALSAARNPQEVTQGELIQRIVLSVLF